MSNIYSMRDNETWGEYQAREQAEKVQAQAIQQQAKEAARNAPAPQPADEQEAIINRHYEAARQELAERAQMTAEQREYETLSAQFESISTRYHEALKNATRNAPEIAALEPQIKTLSARLEQLEKELSPGQAGNNVVSMSQPFEAPPLKW